MYSRPDRVKVDQAIDRLEKARRIDKEIRVTWVNGRLIAQYISKGRDKWEEEDI